MKYINEIKDLIQKNKILFLLSVIAIISIVILFLSTRLSNNSTNSMRDQTYGVNKNAESLDDLYLPSKETKKIYEKVITIAKKNGIKDELQMSEIEVRKDSVIVQDFAASDLSSGYINVIVDIPRVKQSYRVVQYLQNEDSKNSEEGNINRPDYVSCIYDSSKVRYKKFKCKDTFKEDPKYRTLGFYAERYSEDGLSFYMYEDSKELTVDITDYDNSEQIAIKRAKNWVESMGFSTKGIKFTAMNYSVIAPLGEPGR